MFSTLSAMACCLSMYCELPRVYFGTYTDTTSKGIYVGAFDPAEGRLSGIELAAEAARPSFLALHPRRPLVYAVGEVSDYQGKKTGVVRAFAIEASGKLRLLGAQPSGGAGPCHVAVDPTGRCVLVANYGGGSVASLPIEEDGRLGSPASVIQHQGRGPNPRRQEGPHAHSINVDPTGRFALAADLGCDKVFVYRLDAAAGRLIAHDPPAVALAPGAGPRHLAFHPNGQFAYVINELDSTVTAMAYDAAAGRLKVLGSVSTLPPDFSGSNTTADIHVHPSGKFLYGSNRGHDSIAIFAIAGDGTLRPLGHQSTRGKTPRNFTLDPAGQFLLAANQDSDTVAVFRIDAQSGLLSPLGEPVAVPRPVCIRFLPPERLGR